MDITGKKNLQKGEKAIYYPELHWMFLVKPGLCLVAAIALLITREIIASYVGSFGFDIGNTLYKIAFIIIFILALLYMIRKVVEFYLVQYSITNKRLILKKGILTSTLVDMPIEKVESIICVQSLLGAIFNYGTILVSGVGGRLPRYSTVRRPYKVRKVINDIIDKNRKITVTREDLPKPVLVKTGKDGKQEKVVQEIQYGTFVTSYPLGERSVEAK
ncbi:hypothetical protein FACS1894110_17680 [Spirochaetia bacterium]|nr:hypothetical protein FACS1894110_17680 [Spirochaetia bacterium]